MSSVGYPTNPCTLGSDSVNLFWFDPLQYQYDYDDFTGGLNNSKLNWNISAGGSFGVASSTAQNPGALFNQVNSAFNSGNINSQKAYLLGGGPYVQTWVSSLNILSNANNRYQCAYGFRDQLGATNTPNNAVEFQYSDNVNSGKWVCYTVSGGGTPTTNDSGVVADTNYHRFTIKVNAAATSVQFFIDGVLVATNTTHIPTVAMSANANVYNTGTYVAATAGAGYVLDLFIQYHSMTTSR